MAVRLIQEETLAEIADAVRRKIGWQDDIAALITDKNNFYTRSLPEGLQRIGPYAFSDCNALADITIPKSVAAIADFAFLRCKLTSITFESTPNSISSRAFRYCTNLTTINVPWSEGEVAGAPWGATNATINYGYMGGGETI